jgi:hypothetical protein
MIDTATRNMTALGDNPPVAAGGVTEQSEHLHKTEPGLSQRSESAVEEEADWCAQAREPHPQLRVD